MIETIKGLGDPMNVKNFDVTLAAVESAINKDDFEKFLIGNDEKKLIMINDFEFIITGIRLFNNKYYHLSEGIKNR